METLQTYLPDFFFLILGCLLAVAIVSNSRPEFRRRLKGFRRTKTREVLRSRLP